MSIKERKNPQRRSKRLASETGKAGKEVDDLKLLAGNEDADAELERLRAEVAELRKEFYTHLGRGSAHRLHAIHSGPI